MKKQLSLLMLILFALSACDAMDPEQRRQSLHLPPPGFKGNATQGEITFQRECSSCHGEQGQGSNQGPALIHKVYKPSHHADLAFHIAVRDGVKQHHWQFGDMQSISTVSPEDTAHIIAYIRQKQQHANIN